MWLLAGVPNPGGTHSASQGEIARSGSERTSRHFHCVAEDSQGEDEKVQEQICQHWRGLKRSAFSLQRSAFHIN